MKKAFKYIAIFASFILLSVLFLTIFPSIPGNLFMSIVTTQISRDITYDKCQIYFNGNFHLYNLNIKSDLLDIKAEKFSISFSPISFFLYSKTSLLINIKNGELVEDKNKSIKFDSGIILKLKNLEPSKIYVKSDFKVKVENNILSNNSPLKINYDFKKEKIEIENMTLLVNSSSQDFNLKLPITNFSILGFLHNDISLNFLFKIFNSNFSGNFITNLTGENFKFYLKNLDLNNFYKMNPIIPFMIKAKIENISGNISNIIENPEGRINFSIDKGELFNLDCTSPVYFLPTTFGDIPIKLGLLPEFSSKFNKITGSIEFLKEKIIKLNMIIFSDHYKLTINGKLIDFKNVDANLTLCLFKKTLSFNSLNLDFSYLDPDENFNIYGKFFGPIENITPSWNLDLTKLINSATEGMKNKLKDKVNNLFNFMK